MNTVNTVKNEVDKPSLSQDIANSTQAQYLTKKVAKLKSKGIAFNTIANKDAVLSSIVQRVIKSCNFVFDSFLSNDSETCGISYYSKKNKINLNGSIGSDGTIYGEYDILWAKFKSFFIEQREFNNRFLCRHFSLAWATNELDIKNINDLSDLKKSDFLTKFNGEEASLENILTYYHLFYAMNDIDNEATNIKFSSNNFSKILYEICCDMQQQKKQYRAYLFITPMYKHAAHMMALKVSIKNNAVKIKLYDANDTLREQNIVFNSINDVRNLQLKDLFDLNHRVAYLIDNHINSQNDEENCTLLFIPTGYSITQAKLVKSLIS